ncbi:hypothetical protein SYNPS1DRAFT_5649, partial [Syncephalis pseudoplumigaleata]
MIQSCTKRGVVALTFDDGPGERTGNLLDTLAREGIRATFFVLGKHVAHPALGGFTKRALDEGHQIASHTYDHPHMPDLSIGQMRENIEQAERAICNATGVTPRYLRPPYGEISPEGLSLLQEMGYVAVKWDLDSNDWRYAATSSSQHELLATIQDGMEDATPESSFLVLQHDTHAFSVDMVPEIVRLVRGKGFRFATVADCLGNP